MRFDKLKKIVSSKGYILFKGIPDARFSNNVKYYITNTQIRVIKTFKNLKEVNEWIDKAPRLN